MVYDAMPFVPSLLRRVPSSTCLLHVAAILSPIVYEMLCLQHTPA